MSSCHYKLVVNIAFNAASNLNDLATERVCISQVFTMNIAVKVAFCVGVARMSIRDCISQVFTIRWL